MDDKKKRFYKFLIILAFCVATIIGGYIATLDANPPPSGLPVEKITVRFASGGTHDFKVEVASKPIDLEMGLMFRSEMDKDAGMLFETGTPAREMAFWMKNTLIPLDMLFVAADGKIVNIHRNAVPKDLTSIPSGGPVTGVIELNGGRADQVGIHIGDTVLHPYFGTAQTKP